MDIKKINKPKEENLNLKKLNKILPKYFTNTLFIAPTNTGKTNLIINLLDRKEFYKGAFDKVYLFSNTYNTDTIWKVSKTIKPENTFINYSDQDLQDIVDKQEESIKDKKPLNTLIIFDDIIQQINKNKSLINDLVARNRHYKLTIWITTQKFSKVSTIIRNNTSYFILFGIKNKKEKDFIVSELADTVPENDFINLWDYSLDGENYNFLVLSVKDKLDKQFRKQFKSYLTLKN